MLKGVLGKLGTMRSTSAHTYIVGDKDNAHPKRCPQCDANSESASNNLSWVKSQMLNHSRLVQQTINQRSTSQSFDSDIHLCLRQVNKNKRYSHLPAVLSLYPTPVEVFAAVMRPPCQ